MLPIIQLCHGWIVNSYAFFMSFAFAISFLLALRRARATGIDEDRVLTLLIGLFVGSLVGARACFVWEAWEYYARDPWQIPLIWRGGLSFYGGMAGGMGTAMFLAARLQLGIGRTMDLLTPYGALGHAIGRVGCLYHGCCYGRITSGPLGVVFTNGPADHLARHPTQAYECFALLALYLLTLSLRDNRVIERPGRLTGAYLVAYGILRFLLEELRDDMVGPVFAGLLRYQWVSLQVVAVGLAVAYLTGPSASETGVASTGMTSS